jgi:hypothetical protein
MKWTFIDELLDLMICIIITFYFKIEAQKKIVFKAVFLILIIFFKTLME